MSNFICYQKYWLTYKHWKYGVQRQIIQWIGYMFVDPETGKHVVFRDSDVLNLTPIKNDNDTS